MLLFIIGLSQVVVDMLSKNSSEVIRRDFVKVTSYLIFIIITYPLLVIYDLLTGYLDSANGLKLLFSTPKVLNVGNLETYDEISFSVDNSKILVNGMVRNSTGYPNFKKLMTEMISESRYQLYIMDPSTENLIKILKGDDDVDDIYMMIRNRDTIRYDRMNKEVKNIQSLSILILSIYFSRLF